MITIYGVFFLTRMVPIHKLIYLKTSSPLGEAVCEE